MRIGKWLKRQIADHPLRVLAVLLLGAGLLSSVGLPDPDAEDAYGRTPLAAAAYEGDAWEARLWLLLGADVDAREPCGTTPLMRAIQYGHMGLARLLLEAGADPAAADKTGLSALHLAARRGSRAMAQRLIEAGADPDAEESLDGDTPADEAQQAGHEALAEYLRAAG
ncbi:ankyrin repeat domain-containing protein [Halorhodospira neutriphila]|uniref:Ankyrin n=1 Tax=Halorhodospira neutriphila TaxID=168379 RepID=A0ABS1E481_9GAMM|nr:ankyrin repeat domain-containing protein [Halorhodospira neutriphila]MBK1726275.1 hypothetical protein [Halorhodospira neutriphila]